MTLILALRCRDGVVLAGDSQRSEGGLRANVPKLFTSPAGILWGAAGSIAIHQELWTAMSKLSVPRNPGRIEARDALAKAVVQSRARAIAAIENPEPETTSVDAIFAWYSAADRRTYVLRVLGNGHAEFEPRYTAVGGPHAHAKFALSSEEYFEFDSLPLDAAQVIAFQTADNVIRATSTGVDFPVQIGIVTPTECRVLPPDETRALSDTVAAFREQKRGLLVRPEAVGPRRDTGVRPQRPRDAAA
jgi:20S proteasome alpha/beta subunit